jgi:hypothetical protein
MKFAPLLAQATERTCIGDAKLAIDLNGEELFVRIPLPFGGAAVRYADAAIHLVVLGPLSLAVSQGVPCNKRGIGDAGG